MDTRRCEELWRRHADALLLYATSFLSDRAPAEDAIQNVFARLLASASFPHVEASGAYLFAAVRNECVSVLRSRSRARLLATRLLDVPVSDSADGAFFEETRQAIELALMELPGDQREAVVLRVWGDLSIPEAARVAGVTEKAFEHRYYRGLDFLKGKLGGWDERD